MKSVEGKCISSVGVGGLGNGKGAFLWMESRYSTLNFQSFLLKVADMVLAQSLMSHWKTGS